VGHEVCVPALAPPLDAHLQSPGQGQDGHDGHQGQGQLPAEDKRQHQARRQRDQRREHHRQPVAGRLHGYTAKTNRFDDGNVGGKSRGQLGRRVGVRVEPAQVLSQDVGQHRHPEAIRQVLSSYPHPQ
ncbi:unnamed protein product, partial [Ixodes pacificus]